MQDLLARVKRAFHSAFDVDPDSIGLDTQPNEVQAWDSMGHVTLATSLEFNITFDVDDLMAMENVREIIRIVASRLGPAA